MHLEPLGDQAVMAYCDDEGQATLLTARVRRALPAWCVDVVQAYLSVSIYYDLTAVDYAQVAYWLAMQPDTVAEPLAESRLYVIPCCYEFGLDFKRIEEHTGLPRDTVIEMHTGAIFTVYAIGFCPGFPYLGYLPDQLAGVPRLATPRLKVEAGSVGLTGRQTGIYTEPRPGGWNILGRTPYQLVDVKDEYFPLRTGDRVRFRNITEPEFYELAGRRLTQVTLNMDD